MDSTNEVSNQTDGTVDEKSKPGEESTAADGTNGSIKKEVEKPNLVNANLLGENVNGVTASSTILERIPAFDGEKVSLDAVDGDDANDAEKSLSDGPTSSETRVATKANGESNAAEVSEQPEEEQFPDDDDDEGARRDSEIMDEVVADSDQEPLRPRRYELSYWFHHLQRAEKLWKSEEREKSDEWKELWKLVIQFLCESPDAFKLWQQHYMDLGEKPADNTFLSPLQVAASYGLTGLVKILLDRGELATAELEDGRSALWFGADSPDIEMIALLLENGAKPNVLKDFESPFHLLLKWNPKLQFVNLMLEHGADCNVPDPMDFTAMHWFAMFGSDVEVLKVLLGAHGDINIPDTFGETPLHTLMYNSLGVSLDLLRAFLENGADINKDDNHSQSTSW